jgi:uncharacterized protein YjbI with pentapeptide repeats
MKKAELKKLAAQLARLMPNQAHIERFLSDSDPWHAGWAKWRRDNPSVEPHLSGLTAPNRSFQDIYLQDAVVCDANFWHSDLYNGNFSRSICRNIGFRNSRLMKASFDGADLSCADLTHADASETSFRGANLHGASMYSTTCAGADFSGADLSGAVMHQANCAGANFNGAKFSETDLSGAILTRANLSGLDLRETDFQSCVLVETDLRGSDISGSKVYGIAAWSLKLDQTIQRDLIATPDAEPRLVVDNIELAQFVYLMIKNQNIRDVIDTIASKVVLLLGRFAPERLAVLNKMRDALRARGYVPILFDFEKPAARDLTETVSILAHMARFIVADLSDPRCIPHELATIVPGLRSVPVKPVVVESQQEYSMFRDFGRYEHVLNTFRYRDDKHLAGCFLAEVVQPCERKVSELTAC